MSIECQHTSESIHFIATISFYQYVYLEMHYVNMVFMCFLRYNIHIRCRLHTKWSLFIYERFVSYINIEIKILQTVLSLIKRLT